MCIISNCIINSQLPEFKVNAYRKDKGFFEVSNEDLKGKWSVLFFYPGDFTFVCPTELADSHFVHKAWADATDTIRKIEYTMLADMTFELSSALGVLGEESGQAYRGTFLFNPDGELKIAEIHDNGIGRDATELLRKVKAAKFVYEHPGQVCPAKWKEGDATLTPSIDLVGKI